MTVLTLTLGPIGTNSYLVWQEGLSPALLVDCAGDPNQIQRAAQARGLSIRLVVLTHAHADHTEGLAGLKHLTGAPAAIHERDAAMLADPMLNLTEMLGYPPETVTAERLLRDGDMIGIEGAELGLTVLHTPGHTAGSICLLGDEILFSGDCLFAGGIGRLDLPGADEGEMAVSLRRLAQLDPRLTVYPGHGPPTTIGEELETNPWLAEV